MSAVDPIAALLSTTDAAVTPRSEFAETLLVRLLQELESPVRASRSATSSAWQVVWRGRAQRRRWAIALVIALLLLFLAGIATATYLGIRGWVSSTPRGPQHAPDYKLTKVVNTQRLGGTESFALGPGGHDLYFVRDVGLGLDGRRYPQLWRVANVDRGTRHLATRVVSFRSLVPRGTWLGSRGFMTMTANGDAFLVACARATRKEPKCDLQLLVLRRDRTHQRILTMTDLIRAKLGPRDGGWWSALAATAPDRVWLWVAPYQDGRGPRTLLEITDPNGDGNWSDRVVRRVPLPGSLHVRRLARWQLVAEPSLPGDNRSRSVLAVAVDANHLRVYRIAGEDTPAPGRAELVYKGRSGSSVAPWVTRRGKDVLRGLAIAGMPLYDRVSLVDPSGSARSIGRSFRGLSTVLVGPGGVLYVAAGRVVYRMEPSKDGAGTASTSGSPPSSDAQDVFRLPPAGTTRLLVSTQGPDRGESFTVRADGEDTRRLIPGTHVLGVCQSVDGRSVAFSSDAAVPTEFSTYVARDGERPRKLWGSHDSVPLFCPFPTSWLLAPGPQSLALHDLRVGHGTAVLRSIVDPSLSPDGTKLVAVSHRRGRTGLALVDLSTLKRRELVATRRASMLGSTLAIRGGFRVATWSQNGKRFAYYTVDRPTSSRTYWLSVRHAVVVWVRDFGTGRVVLRLSLRIGGQPALSLSPDGTKLLVCARDNGMLSACPAQTGVLAIGPPSSPSRLLLVDIARRRVSQIARGQVTFATWSPADGVFAYALGGRLFVASQRGATRHVATLPATYWKHRLPWLGWSPDGRFIGLGWDRTMGIPVLDVATGKLRVLHLARHAVIADVQWWIQPA